MSIIFGCIILVLLIYALFFYKKKKDRKKTLKGTSNWKSIKEHLKDSFSEDIREKILKYIPQEKLKTKFETPDRVLVSGFVWKNTEEGHEYWAKIRNNFINQIPENNA